MGMILYLLIIIGTTLAYPQYGPVIQEDIHQEPLSEDIQQEPLSEDIHQEPLSEDIHQEPLSEDIHQELFSEDIPPKEEKDDFTKDHEQKLQDFWWKTSGIFSARNKGTLTDTEPGVGVGGPFTPHQSQFCETGFDCVPWELCFEGFITRIDGSDLQQRTKPANYDVLQCGQTGNLCCGIPADILAAQKENVAGIDVIEVLTVEETPEVLPIEEQGPVTIIETEPLVQEDPIDVIEESAVDEAYDPYAPGTDGEKPVEPEVIPTYEEPTFHHEEGHVLDPVDHEVDSCGHLSYKCVPYFLCKDGVVITDGAGLIDVRIKPQGVCTNPEHPDVPGVCCLKPGLDPTPSPIQQCPAHQHCVEHHLCSAKGITDVDGSGGLDLRTGHQSCYLPSDAKGVCCTPPPLFVESCIGESICVAESQCLGKALNVDNEFINYVKTGIWAHCAYGEGNGVCCIQPSPAIPEIIEYCPENSKCMLSNQCTGQALDGSKNFVDYISSGSWASCSLGNIYGICCVVSAPIVRESCPDNSVCVLSDQCTGQALDGSGHFVDYASSGTWSHCSLAHDQGICCKNLPSEEPDACPGESVCLKPEQCTGKALDNVNNFIDYSSQGKWSHCSQYDGGVCCINPQIPPNLQPAPECGIRNYNIDERITSTYGSNEAAFGEFPWQSIIFYQNFTYVCGASLVSGKHVVTAAHCVDGLQPEDIKVRFGDWKVVSTEEILPYVDRNVYKIYIHSQFNSKNVHKDIAVLELSEPIEYQYHINSVCLPKQDIKIKPQTKCFATGWGKDSFEGSFQQILKRIELPYLDHQTCQDLLRKTRLGKYFRLDSSFVCAGGEENKDACYGDGGGPLVYKDEATSQYFLIGITSWGIGCGTKDVPGVYANVPAFSEWINGIIIGKYQEPQGPQLEEHHIDAPHQTDDQQPHETQPYPQPHQPQPHEQPPHQPQPQEPQPYEPQPQDQQPHQPQPHESHLDESQPHEQKPHEPQPHEQQPDKPQPHESTPHEPKPHEQQSQEPHISLPQPHEHQPDKVQPVEDLLQEQEPHEPHPQDPPPFEEQPHEIKPEHKQINQSQSHDHAPDQQQQQEGPIAGYGK